MTEEGIRELIDQEIAGDYSLTNWHGCQLQRCLVQPQLREYDDCGAGPLLNPPPVIQLWLVLEENPGEPAGYKIVYDEKAGLFGLAVQSNTRDVFIGHYGGFLDTYRGM
jgi:hypothetical protein